jgi:NadR type nicotinamide-nucleotide adenylyltransferase
VKTSSKIIVITGAESTGKSTLTEALAKHFNTPYIPEIAREYVEKLDGDYNYNDVETIARMQVEHFREIQYTNTPYIFIDTWLLNTKVWFEEVFEKSPDWLLPEILEIKVDLYLICDIDLPWIYDPVRENGGEKREFLQNRYIENIKEFNFKYEMVQGKNEERFQNTLEILKLLK